MSDEYYDGWQEELDEQAAYEAAMIEAGKEWERQQAEMEEHEATIESRIAELEAENAELKERVARFKKKNKKLKASVKVAAQKSTYWDHQNCKCSVVYTRAEEGEK